MSNEIATLGIRIDSTQVVTGAGTLDKFAAAGKSAAAAAANVEKATAAAGKGAKQMAKSGELARHEMINLSRQIQDVGVSLASGQSPLMVLVQQGTQIADIFGSSKTGSVGGAFKQIVNGIGGARLAMLGITSAAVGAVFAMKGIADSAKEFDDVARSVGAVSGELHGLQQAASNKGIGSDEFAKGAKQFGDAIYDAKNNMGSLGTFLRANGKSATDFQGTLETVADLIKNAKDDQQRLQLLQQAGLPATMQWVRFLSQGAAGIREATAEAVKFNESAEGKMIAAARRFDEAWDTATTRWINRFKSGTIEIVGALSGISIPDWMKNVASGAAGGVLGGPLGMMGGGIAGVIKGTPADPGQSLMTGSQGLKRSDYEWGGPKETVDKNKLQSDIARMQPLLGLLGQAPTAKQAEKPKESEDDRDHLRHAA